MGAFDLGTDHLLVDVSDGIATLTLNRPERLNALSPEMIRALGEVIPVVDADPAVGCLIITGAGRGFCAGGDVMAFAENGGEGGGGDHVDTDAVNQQIEDQERTVGALYRAQTPVIAVLPGAAAGAGLGLALAADFRIGSHRTVITTAFANVALSGDFGVVWFLHQLVGPAKARDLMFFSPRVTAEEALSMGLLDRVVPEDELLATAVTFARHLADGPQTAFRHLKANLLEARSASLSEAMAGEVLRHKDCGLTYDHLSAVEAFAARQAPVFGRSATPRRG